MSFRLASLSSSSVLRNTNSWRTVEFRTVISNTLPQENGVDYELVDHPQAYAAREVAHKTGVRGREFAKTVLVKLDGMMAMAVISAMGCLNPTMLSM